VPEMPRAAGASVDCSGAEFQGLGLVCERLRGREQCVGQRNGKARGKSGDSLRRKLRRGLSGGCGGDTRGDYDELVL
jgi:hypothetical protein